MTKPTFIVLREYRLQTGLCHVRQGCGGYHSLRGCLAEWINRNQGHHSCEFCEMKSISAHRQVRVRVERLSYEAVLPIVYGLVGVWLLKSTSGDCCSPSFLNQLFLPCAFPPSSCLLLPTLYLFTPLFPNISQSALSSRFFQLALCWPQKPWGWLLQLPLLSYSDLLIVATP